MHATKNALQICSVIMILQLKWNRHFQSNAKHVLSFPIIDLKTCSTYHCFHPVKIALYSIYNASESTISNTRNLKKDLKNKMLSLRCYDNFRLIINKPNVYNKLNSGKLYLNSGGNIKYIGYLIFCMIKWFNTVLFIPRSHL